MDYTMDIFAPCGASLYITCMDLCPYFCALKIIKNKLRKQKQSEKGTACLHILKSQGAFIKVEKPIMLVFTSKFPTNWFQ